VRQLGFVRKRRVVGTVVAIGALTAVATSAVGASANPAAGAGNAIKTDINVSGPYLQSRDSVDRCGEPQITQDLRRPKILVMSCMSSYGMTYRSQAPESFLTWSDVDVTKTDISRPCHTFISRDGGNEWQPLRANGASSPMDWGCGDPNLLSGPNGEMYLSGNDLHYPADGKLAPAYTLPPFITVPQEPIGQGFTRSLDGGKTWSRPTLIPLAIDRPLMAIDHSTGVIYAEAACGVHDPVTGIGPYGCTPDSRNLAVSTDQGRTWTPSPDLHNTLPPTGDLTPGRLHDIHIGGLDFMAAAEGVFATAGTPGVGEEGGSGDGVEFKYSTDNGVTFTKRDIPLGDSVPCDTPSVQGLAADPTHRGTFAALVLCAPSAHAVRVFVTRDLGATWRETADLADAPPSDYQGTPSPFGVNRPWVAFGPTGALAVMWRQAYGSARFPALGAAVPGPQDVFLAMSVDGGRSFTAPTRLNTAMSPVPDPRMFFGDDISHVIVDSEFAYVVWGDWRSGELETWFRKVPLPSSR
jgi:hypothetical protein